MKIHHYVVAGLYPLMRIKYKKKLIMNQHEPRLRVLLYHDIAPEDIQCFSKQLHWLLKRWTFLSPDDFVAIVTGNVPLTSDSVLLTFDDGFISNRIIAEKILDPLGIKGLFFVVPSFVSIQNRDKAREFIARHIFPSSHVDKLPDHWVNMTWRDLELLIAGGHMIGSHTLTHNKLSDIQDLHDLDYEISQSKIIIEKHLGVSVEHFAYTFGDIASFSKEAFLIAAKKYKFVHSGLRGVNICNDFGPLTIRRDSLNASDSSFLIGSYLEGSADFYYKKSRSLLDRWASEVSLLP